MLAGCSPQPEPTPTETPLFASEEEAFAAAEETYRSFTDRLNDVDTADPRTFQPLFDLSTGEFEAADRKNYSMMHAEQYAIAGETKVTRFVGVRSAAPYEEVTAEACLDVSRVRVTDSLGNSIVNPDRPDVYGIEITFVAEEDRLLITRAEPMEDHGCAT